MRHIHPKFRFHRGTTPTLAFELPVLLDPAEDRVIVTFAQGYQRKLMFALGDPQLRLEGHDLYVDLQQEDTLALAVGDVDVKIIYVMDGVRDESLAYFGIVLRTDYPEVIG